MARTFRLYGKKRGSRRTGSRQWGSFGEALFYLLFLGVGAVGFYLMLTRNILPPNSWFLLVLPASFVVIGSFGLVRALLQSSTSAERRAAIAQKASRLDLFDDADQRGDDYPNVPRTDDVTTSPGTRLAYRLPIDASPGWNLFGTLLACLFWNGIVVAGWVSVGGEGQGGDGGWFLTLFLIPFTLVGVGLIYYFIRQLMIVTGVGATRIEISGHPLCPGGKYEVFLSQEGRLKMTSLEVLLTCQEQATYRQGTDTRTATECVYQESVYRRDAFDVQTGIPFEDRCEIRVPDEAMHSFKSDHNEVGWCLVVRGDIVGWPDYERKFPLVVYPAAVRQAVMESSQS